MILAVDTSCYTTSICVIEVNSGKIVFECNKYLAVKPGARGLRQSEGFFQHVNQLAEIYEKLCTHVDVKKIVAVAVSDKPRPIEKSYMPVFHAGVLFCRNLANTLSVPLYTYSHQEGHLMAAIKSSGLSVTPDAFIGLHLSGGTTELLEVNTKEDGFEANCLGGTLDLNFGQLIDRIGVQLGLGFPCGKSMDELAQESNHNDFYRIKMKSKSTFNLSGLENKYMALVEMQIPSYVCRHLFNTIAEIILQIILPYSEEHIIVLSGGVASNTIVKKCLEHNLPRCAIYFALPQYARDNAFGIARLGSEHYTKERLRHA